MNRIHISELEEVFFPDGVLGPFSHCKPMELGLDNDLYPEAV